MRFVARTFVSLSVILLLLLLPACGSGGGADPNGTLSVRVADAVTGADLADATFEACPGGTGCAAQPASYEGDGVFTLTLPVGSYTVRITSGGYLSAEYRGVSVLSGVTDYLEQLLLVDEAYDQPAPAGGLITDAFSGSPVVGVDVTLREGINTRTGPVVASTTTDVDGMYGFVDLDAGYYTAELSATGYATSWFTLRVIGGQANAEQNAGIAPPGGDVRIVLTWDATPSDLDSHLTGPAVGGGRFHIYFANKTYSEGGTDYAALDLDDVTSYGPETVTINERSDGTYRYSVHDYSNRSSTSSTALATSGAQVQVYQGGSLTRTFSVPPGAGTLWTVFEFDGTTIVPVNEMSYESSPFAVDLVGAAPAGVSAK
jgi:hypothetical protein